ncbi:MAG: YbaK/EbsC family protein [Candidatus Buchananbacteria bacterium]|nr:YbaK/EbsC family protein [Candidatus Buchananbacteria bacterium]
MAIPAKTKKYLDKKLTKYEAIAHKTVYTAYDAAQTLRRELKDIAKSLVVAADKAYIIVVLPAHMKIDLVKLKKILKAKKVAIPNEKLMIKVFKVKPGAMTAFGGLHKVEVIADKSLLKTKEVILSAGSFTDSVRMKVKDFLEMEQAKLANFAKGAGYKPVKKVSKKIVKKVSKKPRRKPVKKIARKAKKKK